MLHSMLYKTLFRRSLALSLTQITTRPFSSSLTAAMAVPPSSFKLDQSIFNESLYSHIRDFWFHPLPKDATAATPECTKIWFGQNQSPEEKKAFDEECRDKFAHALEALAPEKLALPAFESYEVEIENAAEISKPLLEEVKEAQEKGSREGADMLLSWILLLDQMPRNLYRDPAGLRLVFRHYDRLSFSLIRASMQLHPSPTEAECYRLRPAIMQWYLIPLMHSEHVPSHELYIKSYSRVRDELAAKGDDEAVANADQNLKFEDMHIDPIRKFGRYPHRNFALGRENTREEDEYLKTGATFGTSQSHAENDEQSSGRSEL